MSLYSQSYRHKWQDSIWRVNMTLYCIYVPCFPYPLMQWRASRSTLDIIIAERVAIQTGHLCNRLASLPQEMSTRKWGCRITFSLAFHAPFHNDCPNESKILLLGILLTYFVDTSFFFPITATLAGLKLYLVVVLICISLVSHGEYFHTFARNLHISFKRKVYIDKFLTSLVFFSAELFEFIICFGH